MAKASGHGIATLYRYFGNKPHFLVEIAVWKWGAFFEELRGRSPLHSLEGRTAAVTRYAVGLVYEPPEGFDDEKELETLKEMLLSRYTARSPL